MAVDSPLSVYWISIFLFSSGMGVPFPREGYPSSSEDALDQDWSSLGDLIEPRASNKMSGALAQASPSAFMSRRGSMLPSNPLQQGSGGAGAANPEATRGKGGSADRDLYFGPSSGTSQSQDLTAWNMGAFSPSNDDYSEMAAFYYGYGAASPEAVSEPYQPIFVVQTGGGYKRSRLSATSNQYSLNQGPEAFGVHPEDWANNQMASSTKGSDSKM